MTVGFEVLSGTSDNSRGEKIIHLVHYMEPIMHIMDIWTSFT